MKHWIWAALLACTTPVRAAPDWTQARIVKIEPANVQVTLAHQRIKSLDMEAMTMPFQVDGAVELGAFKAGQKVRFTVVERDSHLVVDRLERAK